MLEYNQDKGTETFKPQKGRNKMKAPYRITWKTIKGKSIVTVDGVCFEFESTTDALYFIYDIQKGIL